MGASGIGPRSRLRPLRLGAGGASVMDTLRHWGWVMSQTEVQSSATDRLVWLLTGACAFLFLVAVVLFVALSIAWRH